MKSAVIYFSNGGKTEELAKGIGDVFRSRMYRITPDEEYGTYFQAVKRAKAERKNQTVPPYSVGAVEIDDVDTVFVGYPIWFSDIPPIVTDCISKLDLKGKRVIPFSTSGTTKVDKTLDALGRAVNGAAVAFPLSWSKIRKDDFGLWVEGIRGIDLSD